VPERLRWAVQVLDIGPNDQVLEIGCGPGVAVSLVCDQLAGGRITAIDRSATAITRATERNAEHLGSGKAVLRQLDLAALSLPGQRFDKIFAVNVNLFWVRQADAEWRIVKDHLDSDGVLYLFYDTPAKDKTSQVAHVVTTALARHGFSSMMIYGSSPTLFCVSGRLPAR
jgi:cyclopropane fatty-acyl-phospholipid synthase-like methyltransferase